MVYRKRESHTILNIRTQSWVSFNTIVIVTLSLTTSYDLLLVSDTLDVSQSKHDRNMRFESIDRVTFTELDILRGKTGNQGKQSITILCPDWGSSCP